MKHAINNNKTGRGKKKTLSVSKDAAEGERMKERQRDCIPYSSPPRVASPIISASFP